MLFNLYIETFPLSSPHAMIGFDGLNIVFIKEYLTKSLGSSVIISLYDEYSVAMGFKDVMEISHISTLPSFDTQLLVNQINYENTVELNGDQQT